MKGYKLTIFEKNQLMGSKMSNGTFYNPVQDITGNWFIFEKEFEACGLGVLSDFIPKINEII